MLDELEFRRRAEAAMESLKRSLIAAEEGADIEVEEQGGVISIAFTDPPAKFVITPNAAARQIWISALTTSFKLDPDGDDFVLAKTGEGMKPLVSRLINEQLGEDSVALA